MWRGRRLGGSLHARLLVIFAFFLASSILQIIVPATITLQSTHSTILVAVDAVRRYNVSDLDLKRIIPKTVDASAFMEPGIPSIGTLPYALEELNNLIAVPPGVQQGWVSSLQLRTYTLGSNNLVYFRIWFGTLEEPGSENLTFIDPTSLRPSVQCSSIPRHFGDEYELHYKPHGTRDAK